jgi:GNAT superfamily N-acetyltransferase
MSEVQTSTLAQLFENAARGTFPDADFGTLHLPSPSSPADAVLAFFGHHIIASDVDSEFVKSSTDNDAFALSDLRFLGALADRLGVSPGIMDAVYVAMGCGSDPSEWGLIETADRSHPRVVRALSYRDSATMRVFEPVDGGGVLLLGHGLAGRLEAAYEVDEDRRGQGLGHRLIVAARMLAQQDIPVFIQISPGNVWSMRALQKDLSQWRPVGSEVLFLRTGTPNASPD